MSYKYIQVPLTPSIASELILESLSGAGKPAKRSDLILYAEREHAIRGGLPSSNVTSTVKKALNNLCSDGKITSIGSGFYTVPKFATESSFEVDGPPEIEEVPSESEADLVIEATVGDGSEIIYVYYNSSDRQVAGLTNRDYWACKIGMTASSLTARLLSQGIHTSLYRMPIVGLVIRTGNARALEKAIHQALDAGNCRIENSLGNEWFFTSPQRILAWYEGYEDLNRKLCAGIDAGLVDGSS